MNWRVTIPITAIVLMVWLLGTWITKYSLGEMAILTPIAVVALGAFAGIVLLWVKVVRDSVRRRSDEPSG